MRSGRPFPEPELEGMKSVDERRKYTSHNPDYHGRMVQVERNSSRPSSSALVNDVHTS